MCEIDADHVLDELADKLRALEMLYKHLGLGDGAKTEGVVIVDSES